MIPSDFRITTAPAAEPVTIAYVKDFIRYSSTALDAQITQGVIDARKEIEDLAAFYPVTQSATQDFTRFPSSAYCPLPLYGGPVSSITAVTYLDQDGASQTLSASLYSLRKVGDAGQVILKPDQEWPDTYEALEYTVNVEYVLGADNDAGLTPYSWVIKYICYHVQLAQEELNRFQRERLDRVLADYIKAYRVRTVAIRA